MREVNEQKIRQNIIKEQEQTANKIAFITAELNSITAFIAVVGFLNGTLVDWVILIASIAGVIMRILEKKTKWMRNYAKYLYLSISFWCTCVLVVTNDGKFAATTQVYFMFLIVCIVYYDVKMVFYHAVITIVSTIAGLVFFPESMFKVDDLGVWLYVIVLFITATVLTAVITNQLKQLIEKTRQMKVDEDKLIFLEQLEKKDEKHSEFIHNMSHYFIAIRELARIENCEEIVSLVEELNGKVTQNERIIYTNHKILNAVLSEKAGEAQEKQIDLEIYIEPILYLENVSDGDLVSMLGNLLDNALEAAEKCEGEKRKISLQIFMEKEGRVCVVKIVNCFVTPPVIKKSKFISGKKDPHMHGIGIKSVEKNIKKYGGYLQCLVEEEKFSAILIIPAKINEK